jgi:O-antigen/teichoic acid export membrane protein
MIQLVLIVALIIFSPLLGIKSILFPGQEFKYIFIIAILEWLNFCSLSLIQFGESKAESVYVQKVNFMTQLVKMAGLIGLFYFGILTLNSFIIVSYVSSLLTIIWIIFFLVVRKNVYLSKQPDDNVKNILSYFIAFCTPLVLYNLAGLAYNFFDRWFLQVISGSVQQAYFSIAFQWTSVAMIFSSSVINIYWRETSFALGKKDFKRIESLYTKLYALLIFLSSFVACFIAFNAGKLLNVFAGKEYASAQSVLIIMACYSIYYTIGQINATFFYAVEEIVLYRNLGILGMLAEVVCTYIFLAPKKFMIPGLELSSLGLAAKSLVLAIIFSNLQLFYITRFLKLNFLLFLRKQIIIVATVFCAAFIISYGMKFVPLGPFIHIFLILVTYLIVGMILPWIRPEICGFNRAELVSYKDKALALVMKYATIFARR